ncbi:MAG: hypothetical protein ACTSVB_11520 [Candidatus Heimdallarchaeaceae archaeon]
MSYIGVTLLLFLAYLPLLWIVIRLYRKNSTFGGMAIGFYCLLLFFVWVFGFVARTIYAGAIEHLLLVGILNILLVIIFELFTGRIIRELTTRRRFRRKITSALVFIIVTVILINSLLDINKTLQSARTFEEMVTIDYSTLPFVVSDEVTEIDNSIRLVTKEFAISRAEQNKAIFGSNVMYIQANVILVNNTLYWCIVYAPRFSAQFWQPGLFNKVLGLILIDVNNPNAEPIIIEFPDGTFNYAEDLWRNHNVNLKSYRRSQTAKYYRSYPAWTGEKWVYVVTRTTRKVYGAWHSDGVDIVDVKTGELINHYGPEELGQTPDYVLQVYSETLLEDYWIKKWGIKRDLSASGNIRLFSGFPNYSPDRIGFYGEGVEDIRYVFRKNSSFAFFATHPLNAPETLAGIGVVTKTDVTFYDLRSEGFISASTASQIAKGQLTVPNEGSYIVQMPVPFTLNTSLGNRLVWIIPIYWESGTVQRLSHVCILDAKETSYIAITNAEGLTGSEAVKEARLSYKSFFSGSKPEKIYNYAQVEKVGTYVKDGNSIFVFSLNDSRTIRCSRDYLNDTHWNDVVLTDVGDNIKYTFIEDDNGILWATEFYLL